MREPNKFQIILFIASTLLLACVAIPGSAFASDNAPKIKTETNTETEGDKIITEIITTYTYIQSKKSSGNDNDNNDVAIKNCESLEKEVNSLSEDADDEPTRINDDEPTRINDDEPTRINDVIDLADAYKNLSEEIKQQAENAPDEPTRQCLKEANETNKNTGHTIGLIITDEPNRRDVTVPLQAGLDNGIETSELLN